jgi:site-specific DNA-cytosine methylase
MKDVENVWDDFLKILIKNNIVIPKFPIWTDWWDKDFEEDDDFYQKYKNWIDKNIEFYNNNKSILEKWLSSSRNIDNWNGAVRKFEWQAGELKQDDGMDKVLWTPRGSGIRVKRLDYIPTLVAMSMIPIYGPKHRKLNPRELLRLQSFPDSFVYDKNKILKQVGNSVNVKMIERCTRFIMLEEPLFL